MAMISRQSNASVFPTQTKIELALAAFFFASFTMFLVFFPPYVFFSLHGPVATALTSAFGLHLTTSSFAFIMGFMAATIPYCFYAVKFFFNELIGCINSEESSPQLRIDKSAVRRALLESLESPKKLPRVRSATNLQEEEGKDLLSSKPGGFNRTLSESDLTVRKFYALHSPSDDDGEPEVTKEEVQDQTVYVSPVQRQMVEDFEAECRAIGASLGGKKIPRIQDASTMDFTQSPGLSQR